MRRPVMPTPCSVRSMASERTDEDSEWGSTVRDVKALDPDVTSFSNSMRSPLYEVEHIGRHMKSSKLRHIWTFFLEAAELKVELEHSRFSGKKKVFVDGKLALSTTAKQLSWCYEHPNSKAKIKLDSENGRHSLRCKEPEKSSQLSTALEAAPSPVDGPLEGRSPRSCPSSTSHVTGRTPRAAESEAIEEIRQNLSARYAVMDDDLQEDVDADVAEEAIPSFPSCLTTRSQQRISLEEVSTETARLNALLGVKDAQIAALQDKLRRCALGKEGSAPAVETGTPSSRAPEPVSPVSPMQQLEGPKPEQHLVAELPTLPVTPAFSPRPQAVTPPGPSPRNCSPGPSRPLQSPVAAPRRSLDDEELDVSHRKGPAVSTPPAAGTPCVARRCMTPPRVSPVVIQRYVATPRRAAGRPVEGVETPVQQFRGRAGSMPPPQLVCASPPPPWRFEPRSSGRPGRASTPCQQGQQRSLSVQPPQRWRSTTPGPQHRSIGDAMLQVPRRIFHAPVQCQPPGRPLAPGALGPLCVQPLVQPQMPRQLPVPMQVALPAPNALPQRALGPPPLLAPVMWRPDSRMLGQPWVQIGQ